jgi:hypothetical protein
VTFEKDNAERQNAEIIFYHDLAFTFNLDEGYSNKDLMFSAIGAKMIKFWFGKRRGMKPQQRLNMGYGKLYPRYFLE